MWNTMDESGFGGKTRFDPQGGGGFLNTTISSPSSSDKKKVDRVNNVLPCTIAQIHLMPETDDNLKIGSVTAKIITFLGLVQKLDVQSTKVTYMLNDFTGPEIEVQMWIGESDDPSKTPDVVLEGNYARVTGAIRSMKGKRHVIAFNVQPMTNINEITMHIAEVVHASMAIASMDKQNVSTGVFDTSTKTVFGGMSESSNTYDSSNLDRRLTKRQLVVKQAIVNCKDEQGIDVKQLASILTSMHPRVIQEEVDFLSNEGHIYSTIDEDHYKSTDSI